MWVRPACRSRSNSLCPTRSLEDGGWPPPRRPGPTRTGWPPWPRTRWPRSRPAARGSRLAGPGPARPGTRRRSLRRRHRGGLPGRAGPPGPGFRRRRSRPAGRRLLRHRRQHRRLRQLGRAAGRGAQQPGHHRRDPPERRLGRVRPCHRRPPGRSRRRRRRRDGRRPGPAFLGSRRSRARGVRGRPGTGVRRHDPDLPGLLRFQRQGGDRGAVRHPARRGAVRPRGVHLGRRHRPRRARARVRRRRHSQAASGSRPGRSRHRPRPRSPHGEAVLSHGAGHREHRSRHRRERRLRRLPVEPVPGPGRPLLRSGDRRSHRLHQPRSAGHHLQLLPDPRPQDPGGDRPHPQRHLPHRGREGPRRCEEPAVHAELPRCAGSRQRPRDLTGGAASPTRSSAPGSSTARRCGSARGGSPGAPGADPSAPLRDLLHFARRRPSGRSGRRGRG